MAVAVARNRRRCVRGEWWDAAAPVVTRATTVQQLAQDVNKLAQRASQAATENPHWVMRYLSQIVVLSTSGLTTDSAVPMLRANTLLSHVTIRVTQAITGAVTTLAVGDATTAGRFQTGFTSFAVGDGAVCLAHWDAGKASQATDAALRVTADDTVTGGAMEIIVWYWSFAVPSLPIGTVATPAPPSGTGATGGLRLFGPRFLG